MFNSHVFSKTLYNNHPVNKIFFFIESELDEGYTQPPIQWVIIALSSGAKQTGCKAHHSSQHNTENKDVWSYKSTGMLLN